LTFDQQAQTTDAARSGNFNFCWGIEPSAPVFSESVMRNGPYELVLAPDDYPGKRYRGRYCYEHHLVFWRAHGVLPGDDETIHHKNGNRRDNRLENLELLKRGAHTAQHNREHGRKMVEMVCPVCGHEFSRRWANTLLRGGMTRNFCSRKCMGKARMSRSPIGATEVVRVWQTVFTPR